MERSAANSEKAFASFEPLELTCSQHVVALRQQLRELSVALGFGIAAKSRLVMCATELAENVIKHVGSGWCEIHSAEDSDGMGLLNVTIRDNGSGIGKLSHVLGERFDIETNPLGTGLAGVRRVADCFEIESSEKGTRVCVGFRLPSGGDL